MRVIAAILYIVLTLVVPAVMGQQVGVGGPNAPVNVRVSWIDSKSARFEWTQTSDANQVCISKSQSHRWIGLGCYPGKQSRYFNFVFPHDPGPNDAVVFPQPGEIYHMVEVLRREDGAVIWSAEWGNWTLGDRPVRPIYLPVFAH